MKLFDRMLFLLKNMARTSSTRLFQNQLLKNIYSEYWLISILFIHNLSTLQWESEISTMTLIRKWISSHKLWLHQNIKRSRRQHSVHLPLRKQGKSRRSFLGNLWWVKLQINWQDKWMLVLSSIILIKSKRYSRKLLDRWKITIRSQGKIVKNKELSLKRYISHYLATKKGVGS